MGNGSSQQTPMVGSLSGGRTTLAGTFIAEKTHSNPPKYTLVSVSAAHQGSRPGSSGEGPGQHGGAAGSATGGNRRGYSEKTFGKLPCNAALIAIEPLLTSEEAFPLKSPARPWASGCGASAKPAEGGAPLGTPVAPRGPAPPPTAAPPEFMPGWGALKEEGSEGQKTDKLRKRQSATAARRANSGGPSEVFNRLARDAQRPWMAEKTDAQLLAYLARRTGDPEIASPNGSQASSTLSGGSGSKRVVRRHRNHRELFDSCLDRPIPLHLDCSPILPVSPATSPSGSREAHVGAAERRGYMAGGKLAKPTVATAPEGPGPKGRGGLWGMLEEVAVLPEDAVGSYFEREELRRLHSGGLHRGSGCGSSLGL